MHVIEKAHFALFQLGELRHSQIDIRNKGEMNAPTGLYTCQYIQPSVEQFTEPVFLCLRESKPYQGK